MRDVNVRRPFLEKLKFWKSPEIQQQEDDDARKKFADEKTGRFGKKEIKEFVVREGKIRAIALDTVSESERVLSEASEVINESLWAIHTEIVREMQASGVLVTEAELVRKKVSLQDFFNHLVINFDLLAGHNGAFAFHDPSSNNVILNYARFSEFQLGANNVMTYDKPDKAALLHTLVHEFLHFSSFQELTIDSDNKLVPGSKVVVGYGVEKVGDKKKGVKPKFSAINEGVTELYAQELADRLCASLGYGDRNKEASIARISYVSEQKFVKKLLDYLAKYSKTTTKQVWEGFKVGYFEGNALENRTLQGALKECFGSDVIENLLADFKEKNSNYAKQVEGATYLTIEKVQAEEDQVRFDGLEKRWLANGAKLTR